MPRKKLSLALLFCLWGSLAFGQKNLIRFNNLTIDNGLTQGSISGIVHGKEGFIWIATADGLHRYDGYNFRIYRNNPNDPNSLPDNYISCLYEDRNGILYTGLYNGEICVLDKFSGHFRRILIHNEKTGGGTYPVTCIGGDGNGYLLIGTDGAGMIRTDTSGKRIKRYHTGVTPGLTNNSIRAIVKDPYTPNYWIATGQGICAFNPVNETFVKYPEFDNLAQLPITCVLGISPDELWIGTSGKGLYTWKRGSDSSTRMTLPRSKGTRFISCLVKNPDSEDYWIGTLGGLICKSGERVTLYANNPLNPESLVDNNIQTATFDRFGSLWIGTINGVSRFDKRLKRFELFREFRWKDTLINNNIYSIYEDPDHVLWLGTLSAGIIRYDHKTDELKAWPVLKAGGTETRMVRTILKDRSGQFWIGSRDGGLYKFFPEQDRFEQILGEKGFEISSPTIRSLCEDRDGNLWVGTANGLNLYDKARNRFTLFRGMPESPVSNNIYQIRESPGGNALYLACFRGGFQVFDRIKHTFKIYRLPAASGKRDGQAYAMCFESYSGDSMLVGTYGSGLFFLNLNTGGFRNLTEKNGLSNNSVYGILPYGKYLWMSTNRGLSRLNTQSGLFTNFGLKNYIQSHEFNEGAYCKTADGTFFFGGVNGLNYFRPGDFHENPDLSVTAITIIKKGDTDVPIMTDPSGRSYVELHYNDNLISFEFARLNFLPTQMNQYIYKLEGFDENWIMAGPRTVAYYTKLSPGIYTFRVHALGDNGKPAGKAAFLRIIIEPPFWQTWWFYTLSGLLFLIILYLFFRWRTRILNRDYRHKLAELELKALRSQMNPHFIFNSLNSIQYFILKKEPRDAYNYLTKFSKLMRMILQNSKHKSISLQDEYEWLKTYLELENLRMENTLDFEIRIGPDIQQDRVFVPTMLLQPYVENALIHGLLPKKDNRKLLIDIGLNGKNLKCTIEDNGIGRIQSQELNKSRLKHHESTAMTLTRDRLAILNIESGGTHVPQVTDLYDENGQAAGTRVELTIPLILEQDIRN